MKRISIKQTILTIKAVHFCYIVTCKLLLLVILDIYKKKIPDNSARLNGIRKKNSTKIGDVPARAWHGMARLQNGTARRGTIKKRHSVV